MIITTAVLGLFLILGMWLGALVNGGLHVNSTDFILTVWCFILTVFITFPHGGGGGDE